MFNFISGISVLALSLCSYVLAFYLFRKNKIFGALLIVMLTGLLLRLYSATDLYIHNWDERYHALVAQNMMQDPLHPQLYKNPVLPYDYKNWTQNHTWLHKQPITLWCMALSMKVFGVNELALRLPSLLFSILGIWLVFLIGKEIFGTKAGFIAAFLYSMNGLIIEHVGGRAATDHVDMAFLFFVELAVWWAVKFARSGIQVYHVLCGITIGVAVLTKWLPALIVWPVWLLLMLHERKHSLWQIIWNLGTLIMITLCIALPWQVYIHQVFAPEAAWENSYNNQHITEAVEEQAGPWYFHWLKMGPLFGFGVYLPLAWLLYRSIRGNRQYHLMMLAVWIFVPYVFFSIVQTKMTSYILICAPAIFLGIGYFLQELAKWEAYALKKIILPILSLLLLLLPAIYSVERLKMFDVVSRTPPWKNEILALKSLPDMERSVLINVPRPIETMFYVPCVAAYSQLCTTQQIDSLLQQGYTVYINHNQHITAEYENIPGVKWLSLKNEELVPIPITRYNKH